MIPYPFGSDVNDLDFWPFDNPASQYKVVQGKPKAYGRLDAGGAGQQTRLGIWRCTKGSFECIEQGDELMIVLSGRCRIVNHTEREASPNGPIELAGQRS